MRVLASAAILCLALALGTARPARAATNTVSPVQSFSCTNQVTTALVQGTGAFTCSSLTAAMFATGTQGTVLNSPSSTTFSFTAAPVLGVAGSAAGTMGLASGTTSGVVTIENTGATSSWHLDMPATGGATNGQVMTWQGADTPMTWASVLAASFTVTPETSGPITLLSANDRVIYSVSSAAVTFNLTGSVVAGDNWCFEQTSTNAWTLSANSISGMTITLGNIAGTAASGSLVSGGAGSFACVYMQTATAAQVYASNGALTNN